MVVEFGQDLQVKEPFIASVLDLIVEILDRALDDRLDFLVKLSIDENSFNRFQLFKNLCLSFFLF